MDVWSILLVISALASACTANFFIASAPDGMEFISDTQKTLRRRELPGVINFLMCLSSEHQHKTESWAGMKKLDMFNPPEANLLITVHVPDEAKFALSKYVMKYITDDLETSVPPIFGLNSAIVAGYGDRDLVKSFVLQNDASDAVENTDLDEIGKRLDGEHSVIEILPEGSVMSLSKDSIPDLYFFREMQMLKDALGEMHSTEKSNVKQSFHVMLTSVDSLVQSYGADSMQVKEAMAVLQYYIPHFIESVNARFHNRLLCEVEVTSATPSVSDYLVRRSRSLLQAEEAAPAAIGSIGTTNFTLLNLAEPNSSDFAVVFSIVFWLMLGFFLAVLASTYVMWFMDPGKDNIIYRVTSQRMKME